MTRDRLADLGFLVGAVLIVTGVAMWSRPLACIVCGVALCSVSVLLVRRKPTLTNSTDGTPERTG